MLPLCVTLVIKICKSGEENKGNEDAVSTEGIYCPGGEQEVSQPRDDLPALTGKQNKRIRAGCVWCVG